uniref:Uncharacterized protein n=1 Tax=Strongyloides stercoralis TaxID=6248 RepID=A0A0K0ES10_STRER
MISKFCGLKFIFNNIKFFRKDDKKSIIKNDLETDVKERYAVFNRARSLKLIGPNMVSKGSDIFKIDTAVSDILPYER